MIHAFYRVLLSVAEENKTPDDTCAVSSYTLNSVLIRMSPLMLLILMYLMKYYEVLVFFCYFVLFCFALGVLLCVAVKVKRRFLRRALRDVFLPSCQRGSRGNGAKLKEGRKGRGVTHVSRA